MTLKSKKTRKPENKRKQVESDSDDSNDINPNFSFEFTETVHHSPEPPNSPKRTCFAVLDDRIAKAKEKINNLLEKKEFPAENIPNVLKCKVRRLNKSVGECTPEIGRLMEYSETLNNVKSFSTFDELRLSRPLLRGINEMCLTAPTRVQCATVPLALSGRDMSVCAATGSGKTASFMLPALERLIYKPKDRKVIRVLVLVPTRELAVQVKGVTCQLAKYTNIESALATGGLSVQSQEDSLKESPDVLIATPGRLLDLLANRIVNLKSVEILIMDEADRLLDDNFLIQVKGVLQQCGHSRQTMLFSATMTEKVEQLSALSLRSPVKVEMDTCKLSLHLKQEFVRIRPEHEEDRPAVLACLLKMFLKRVIVFVQTKVSVRRLHVLMGLLGVNVGELHGNLSQGQRMEMLSRFKDGELEVLLATDLASRGLDIEGVETVINYSMPHTLDQYIHRVGRTARAGKTGRAVSLVGEDERKVLREVIKASDLPPRVRTIPTDCLVKYSTIQSVLQKEVDAILMHEDVPEITREDKPIIRSTKCVKSPKLLRPIENRRKRKTRLAKEDSGDRAQKLSKRHVKRGMKSHSY